MDTDTGEAIWASGDVDPGEWIGQYVTGRRTVGDTFGALDPNMLTGPAEQADLPAPELTVDSDIYTGGIRTLTVTVRPQRAVRLIYLEVPDTTVFAATVEGEPVPAEDYLGGLRGDVPCTAGRRGDLRPAARIAPPGHAAGDGRQRRPRGLPGFTPRPDGVGIRGTHTSELVLVAKNYTV